MSRSSTFMASGVAVSVYPWIPQDHHVNPFRVTYHVLRSGTGDATFSVEGTISNLETGGTNVEIVSAQTFALISSSLDNVVGDVAFPLGALRLRVSAVSGAANLSLLTMQAGN